MMWNKIPLHVGLIGTASRSCTDGDDKLFSVVVIWHTYQYVHSS